MLEPQPAGEQERKFTIFGTLGLAWESTKVDFPGLMAFLLLPIIVIFICLILGATVTSTAGSLGACAFLSFCFVLSMLYFMGAIRIGLCVCDNEPLSFAEFVAPFRRILSFSLAVALLLIGICAVPTVMMSMAIKESLNTESMMFSKTAGYLLIAAAYLPLSLFFLSTLKFAPFFVVDKNLGPVAALARSAEITKGNRWRLLGLDLLCLLIALLGAILFLLGLIPAAMVLLMGLTYSYRFLSGEAPAGAISSVEALPF